MTSVIFFALMAILCVFDWKIRLLPNLIVIPATIASLVIFKQYLPALLMFCIMTVLYSWEIWAGGDVKLAIMVAAFLGWQAFAIVGLTFLIVWLYRKIRVHYWPLPVAPFMFFSCFLVLLWKAV